MTTDAYSVASHFAGKSPSVRQTYERLLQVLKSCGPVGKEAKKTSIHLVNRTAFAGIATRKDYLILTIRSDHDLQSPRVHKTERVSAKRFHSELKLASPAEVDGEVAEWLRQAYALSQ
jgi:hypothetical protein